MAATDWNPAHPPLAKQSTFRGDLDCLTHVGHCRTVILVIVAVALVVILAADHKGYVRIAQLVIDYCLCSRTET